jgi:hypothetical protein
MRQPIRYGIAVTLIALSATTAAGSARAGNWCGSAHRGNAIIQCGYTTIARCESAIGKGGRCFVDPDTALNIRRATPVNAHETVGISEQASQPG